MGSNHCNHYVMITVTCLTHTEAQGKPPRFRAYLTHPTAHSSVQNCAASQNALKRHGYATSHHTTLLQEGPVCPHIEDTLFAYGVCRVTHSPAPHQPSVLIKEQKSMPQRAAVLQPHHLFFIYIKQRHLGEWGLFHGTRFAFEFIYLIYSQDRDMAGN